MEDFTMVFPNRQKGSSSLRVHVRLEREKQTGIGMKRSGSKCGRILPGPPPSTFHLPIDVPEGSSVGRATTSNTVAVEATGGSRFASRFIPGYSRSRC